MNLSFEVDGNELGILSSKCYVLEKEYDLSEYVQGEYKNYLGKNVIHIPEYPHLLSNYLIFSKHVKSAKVENYFHYEIKAGEIKLMLIGAETKAYIYRPIQSGDSNDTYGLNMYNENGELFYSSSKTPLRIKDFVKLEFGHPLANPKPIMGYKDCMVLSMNFGHHYQYPLKSISFPAINSEGGLFVGYFNQNFGGAGITFINNDHAVVAYAPDSMPRWK
ncbi:hypothetical protein [Xenorhabdus hominickii]|uniref:Uncharacterized protein n=1 Tax=Xenorhabdus hominickii TaxID=351679 RepID=A0A1V0M482_XENHO|nr:hypothetical protein [Xenorhabdus hominickii]ARD69672.1 hypothetical protein [Xenorhabdus hominickii]PHM52386.1 hypothetical protein Xhom_04464 [Xenorhabdus hominickii]